MSIAGNADIWIVWNWYSTAYLCLDVIKLFFPVVEHSTLARWPIHPSQVNGQFKHNDMSPYISNSKQHKPTQFEIIESMKNQNL